MRRFQAEREARRARYEAAFMALGVAHKQISERIGLKGGYQSMRYLRGYQIIPSDKLDAIERLAPADFPEGRIDRRIPIGLRDQARAEDMKARLLADETLESISQSYGVTRERVRQIIVRLGVVNPRHAIAEANRTAKQAEHDDKLTARAAKRAERDAILQKARVLVEQGMSIRKAMVSVGLSAANKRSANRSDLTRGWPSQHGRWRPELAARREQIVALYTAGPISVSEVAQRFGVHSFTVYYALRMAGIDWRWLRARKPKPPKPPRRPVPRPLLPITDADQTGGPWTGQTLWTLTDGWAMGKTASMIAEELGPPFTRNSVLGKLFRMRRRPTEDDIERTRELAGRFGWPEAT